MARYIIEKKGIFGTLYIDTPTYSIYPSTTRDINKAFKFKDYDKAVKVARKIFADVVEIEEDEPIKLQPLMDDEDELDDIDDEIKAKPTERKIVLCKNCAHFKHPLCELDNEPKAIDDFCSKAKENN